MFEIEVIGGQFEVELSRVATLESEVSNTADNKGFAYFWAVDRGRKAIVPVNAKALRFVTKEGDVVFSKHAKAAPAQHLTDRTLKQLLPNAISASAQARGNSFAVWARGFLRAVAQMSANTFQSVTPTGITGKLRKSYKVNVAG